MAFLLLFRVSTGDNWNGIMKVKLKLMLKMVKINMRLEIIFQRGFRNNSVKVKLWGKSHILEKKSQF